MSERVTLTEKRSLTQVWGSRNDQQVVEKIVDPFLQWYNELFHTSDNFEKLYDYSPELKKQLLENEGGFQVNKETLFNILAADVQDSSKIQTFHTFPILPVIPDSVAEKENLKEKTYANKVKKYCKGRDDKCKTVRRMKVITGDDILKMNFNDYVTSTDFVDTRDLCKAMSELKIVNKYFNESEEYKQYKKQI